MARKGLPATYIKQAGGDLKKAWRLYRGGSRTPKRSVRSTAAKKGRAIAARGKAILGKYGATGLVEDAAIGYFGSNVLMTMGYPLESAMPMTRVAQGAIGMALNRRGKGRLAYGIIDLIDVYLIKRGFNLQGISIKAWQ